MNGEVKQMNVSINELLLAKQKKASDVHLTAGASPKCRICGELIDMDYPKLLPEDTEAIAMPIIPPRLKNVLLEKGEIDFAYSIPSIGRYRVNVFKQRGAYALAIRLINTTIPKPEELGLPSSIVDLTKKSVVWY